jgi:LacI family transcriptional regulator
MYSMSSDLARRATARDVATLADVSVATVSLVVNGKALGRVTPETQERVRDAIRQLDYHVNSTASSLARGTRDTVAFVAPDPTNPFFALVLEGIAAELDGSFSLSMLMPTRGDDYDSATVRRALAGDLAGLVLASPGPTLLDSVALTCPTILMDSGGTRAGMVSVDLDVASAAAELADHLVGLGHRRVAYVGIGRDKATLQHRREALRAELESRGAGLSVPDLSLPRMATEVALEEALVTLPAWLEAGVTAVVCGDDLLAFGVLQAARRLDIPVPGALSVASFNNLPFAAMVDLTTVDLGARELGSAAGRALSGLLGSRSVQQVTTIPTGLVVRGSTGAVAG